MHAPGRPPTRRLRLLLTGAAIAVAAVCAMAAWHPWTSPVSAPAAGAQGAVAAPAPLALPTHPKVLIFGDSWVYGSAAALPRLGFAYVAAQALGWDATVDGVRGSGYLRPGIDGPAYGERIAALDPALDPDLVIVEGSINDRTLYPTGYVKAVESAWDDLARTYPRARIVILGPAPQVLPVQRGTRRIDETLARLAADRGWWYISPIEQQWITADNYDEIIDTLIGRDHPSTAGHAYLAQRLEKSIAAISGDARTAEPAAGGIR